MITAPQTGTSNAASMMTTIVILRKLTFALLIGASALMLQVKKVTGFKDTKLPFGANPRPGIFRRLTQAVKRMIARTC